MNVRGTWTRTITIVALISSTSCSSMPAETSTSTESSADYLRKVMQELGNMNSPTKLDERTTGGTFYLDVDDKHYLAGKRYSSGKGIAQQTTNDQNDLGPQASIIRSVVNKILPVRHTINEAETKGKNIYYQVSGADLPSLHKTPEISALTKADINAVYRQAIDKENAVSLNAFANVLRHRQLPKVTTNQVEIGESQPMYNYYFYPLKSFMNDAHQGNGLLPEMHLRPENTELLQNSQKDMGNPLFMAISGFIGMAMLFMIGILVLPRLGDFNSRVANNEKFLDITKTVGEAIERHNCTDKQAPYMRLDNELRIFCQPVKISKPSSVVLLTKKSAIQKEAKRRRKISKKCKIPPCKKNLERNGPT